MKHGRVVGDEGEVELLGEGEDRGGVEGKDGFGWWDENRRNGEGHLSVRSERAQLRWKGH